MATLKFTEGGGRLVGYARVSTQEQDTALQLAAFKAAGIEVVFEESRSGGNLDRPALAQALKALRKGDTLCVYKIDRLARSLIDLMSVLGQLDARGVGFKSLTEPIETVTPAGRLMLQILGAFAEFERAVILERSRAGRAAAVARGVRFGRPRTLDYAAVARLSAQGLGPTAIGRRLGVSSTSVGCALAALRRDGGAS